MDLTAPDGPELLYQSVKEKAGGIDVLVNNAGIAVYGRFWDQAWEPLEKTIKLNLHVPTRLMHLFCRI